MRFAAQFIIGPPSYSGFVHEGSTMSTMLALVVDHPQPGEVFRDLTGLVGADEAARIYRAAVMDICEVYADLNVRSRILFYRPKESRKQIELLANRQWRAIARTSNDRGALLIDLAERAFKGGHRRVLALWPSAAMLPAEFILNAFDMLLVDDLVIGPTIDGDVYAVGFSTDVPFAFQGFDWDERKHVFSHLIDRADRLNLVTGLLPHYYTIDVPQGLQTLSTHLKAEILSEGHARAHRLAAVMQKLMPGHEPGTTGS